MKYRIPLLLSLLLFCFSLTDTTFAQNDVKTVYNQGVQLYNEGKYEEAMMKFAAVLQANPRIVHARSYMAKCKTAMVSDRRPTNNIQGQLAQITIPELNFSDAPIGDILDYFTQRAEELSGGKVSPNFIYKGTPEQRRDTLVTLSLRNVPMTEAIRYVGQLSGTHIKYEEHAIVADPNYHAQAHPALEKTGAGSSPKDPFFGQPAKSNVNGAILFD